MDESPTAYTIHLLGFTGIPDEEAAAALAKAFSVDLARAVRLVERAPVKVKSRATRQDAERYIGALLQIGADVRVDTGTTSRTFKAADRPSAGHPRNTQSSAAPSSDTDERTPPPGWSQASTSEWGPTPHPEASSESTPTTAPSSPYWLSPEDDDGLFAEETTFRPGDLLLGKEE